MKRWYRVLVIIMVGVGLVGAGSTLSLAAKKDQVGQVDQVKVKKTLHRDGSAAAKERRITQADRQAAAARAKAKGMKIKKVGQPETSEEIVTPIDSEAKQ
jgi:hypothetical protein